MNPKPPIKIELTAQQKEHLQKITGKEVAAVKLRLEPLEARLAPKCYGCGAN